MDKFAVKKYFRIIGCLLVSSFLSIVLVTLECAAERPKVLVVMSYEENFPWCQEIRQGIEELLAPTYEIIYFYMNTKIDFQSGPEKAQQAWDLYSAIKPQGIIAVDDNAQSMFVVPYLKDKTSTPVIFCGVNAEPEKYGYPASNVSGVLERLHIAESLAFAQQLVPTLKTFSFVTKEGPVSQLLYDQIEQEKNEYTLELVKFVKPKTKKEAIEMVEKLRTDSDLLFMETLQGVTDEQGKSMEDREIMPIIAEKFGKITLGSNKYAVQYAALCAVVKTGQEQGTMAAEMLLDAMNGTPYEQLPIRINKYGKRIINVSVMKELGLSPQPIILQGVELIRKAK